MTGQHQNYGFIEFKSEEDADYAVKVGPFHTVSNSPFPPPPPGRFEPSHTHTHKPTLHQVLNMIKLFGKPIRVNKASHDRQSQDVGANLFIGNLDPSVDEKLLYDTFSAFGVIIDAPKIMRDPDTGTTKGFGFVAFDSFEASDAAIEAMHGQFLSNKTISVQYAYKKDAKGTSAFDFYVCL